MQSVRAWEEKVVIPTYQVGKPNKNPMFLEKRVYQGTSGVVYPHPVIDKIYDEKVNKKYKAVFLENEYLKIMILPELGGRVQMAYDKTNNYHFIYYNPVIKPALVGLTGPWISGGIEFNWPQHHRPSTFDPVDFTIEENRDGSKTIWVSEMEIMFHTKGMTGFTLYPDKAYLEVRGKLYNRTPFPQSFLWWSNPAVEVDEHYQSVFPPDVHAVYDHGKRDVSSFPIATGTYYKVDYSPGTDISRYQNIPVPTSYMAVNSKFDFVGGYHYEKGAGMLHVADHHISPGKKQWTWGAGEFGKMWDKQLTDPNESGIYPPYFEIMTGVYTDNQPDFSWIMPNEERTFRQYFLPYKEIGYMKNASENAAVNLETKGNKIIVKVYVTAVQNGIQIILRNKQKVLLNEKTDLSPLKIYTKELVGNSNPDDSLELEVLDKNNKLLINYTSIRKEDEEIPQPAKPIGKPAEIKTTEDLYLAGLHLEQYRHATYSPVAYYEEALRRDPTDIRCNNALGLWYVRHGRFAVAEPYFHKAISKLIRHNPNPYNGEPYYDLGLCLSYQENWDDAYDAFYKACWNAAWQDNGYLQLAYIDCRRGDFEKALENVEHSMSRNYHGMKARHLKSILLRKLNKLEGAIQWTKETLSLDKFDFGSRYELFLALNSLGKKNDASIEQQKMLKLIRGWEQSYIEIGIDYANSGCYHEAIQWLSQIKDSHYPMVHYYLAYYYSKIRKDQEKNEALQKAYQLSEERVFPNRLEDILVLQVVVQENSKDFKAYYYLGNLWYDKRQYQEAQQCWEKSIEICNTFPTSHRNLGIVYFNKLHDPVKSLQHYEEAFRHDPSDARILFELDQLYKRTNKSPIKRLAFLKQHFPCVEKRDDLYVEFITLQNLTGNYAEALRLLNIRKFHPWEGGEGKVSRQYVHAKIALAKQEIDKGNFEQAIQLLTEAQHFPDNLGEGKLYGAKENDINFWLGFVFESMNNKVQALHFWQLATAGSCVPSPAVYYNDQPPEMIFFQGLALQRLGKISEAKKRFQNLIDYGKKNVDEPVIIDFFAVSLPELSVFDIDWDKQNHIHCHYLMGLGYLGLGEKGKAENEFKEVLKLDPSHQGTLENSKMIVKEKLG